MKTFILSLALFSFTAAAEDSFHFRFAYRNPAQGGVASRIEVQGALSSDPILQLECGASGRLCACEFRNAAGKVVETAKKDAISYEPTGHYFRCIYSGTKGPVTKVRVFKNKQHSGAVLEIRTRLGLPELLGRELDLNRLRYIYRYACEFNFLQKEGTTTQSFDCTNTQVSCDPSGDPGNNFCLLQARFPFFLFADTYSTNFHMKPSDRLYNGGNRICGLQIRQYNCAGEPGAPVKHFGLYGEQTDIWKVSVNMNPAPDFSSMHFGFAALTSPVTGECPPGLEKRIFQRANVITSDIFPSHNFTNGLVSTEVSRPGDVPAPFSIEKLSGGRCAPGQSPTDCSMPVSWAGAVKSQAYSSAGETVFCVIPAAELPHRVL